MGYKELQKKAMDDYNLLKKEYDEITENQSYMDACEEMPFAFLEAKQKAEVLKLYKDKYDKDDAPFKFKRADEAIIFLRSIVDLKKSSEDILENASIIVRAGEIADKINKHVDDSPFLPDTLKIEENVFLMDLACDCLKVIPEYPSLLTKDFKTSYVQSCLENLSENSIRKVIECKYISVKDLDNIKLHGSENYEKNIKVLQEVFGIDTIPEEQHTIRLAGTSKNNEDGTSRQEILKEMSTKGNVPLRCEKGIFKPEVGKELKSVAVIAKNEDKTLGYVPQAVVDQMYEKYENPQFDADNLKVIGGGSVNYGAEVNLKVIAKELNKTEEKKTEDNEVEKE